MLSLGIDIGGSCVKGALLRDGTCVATHSSGRYRNPSATELLAAVKECSAGLLRQCLAQPVEAVGMCAPGLLNTDRSRVVFSANVPGLQDLELVEAMAALQAMGGTIAKQARIVTDQIAAATDYSASYRVRGRLLAVSIGTGIGAAVLDSDDEHPLGRPLRVNGDSPGHIGQMDVSLSDGPPIGSDGGAGSLEAYMGAAALRGRDPTTLRIDDVPVRALVRALRICHAIYRPQEIALVGGVGIRLRHLGPELRERVSANLSKIAREDWKLGFGEDDYHAARGAARLAAR